jgi:hypothetical protein
VTARRVRARWRRTGEGVAALVLAAGCGLLAVAFHDARPAEAAAAFGLVGAWLLRTEEAVWTEGDRLVHAVGGREDLVLRRREVRRVAVAVRGPGDAATVPVRPAFEGWIFAWRPRWRPAPYSRPTMRRGANVVVTTTAGEERVLPLPSGWTDVEVAQLAASLERWRAGT